MDNEKIFTVWEKTEMFSGYYKVMYFTLQPFNTNEQDITQILNHQIKYVENVKMTNEKTKNFIKEIEQLISDKRQSELAIIRFKYPNQIDINISLFGKKKWVKIIKNKLQIIVDKHTIKQIQIKINEIQVNLFDIFGQCFLLLLVSISFGEFSSASNRSSKSIY
jgi:hypothetical protein